MKAVRVTAQAKDTFDIAPLPLPAIQRKGVTAADAYRRQSTGQNAGIVFNPNASDAIRAIVLSDGHFKRLASHPGALLTFVISGELIIDAGPEKSVTLVPGDILFTDEQSAANLTVVAKNQCRLVQIGVAAEWPGPNAEIQESGTTNPRVGSEPTIWRINKGDDDKAYRVNFTELFPAVPNQWSIPRPVTGFRMLCWEGGSMDYHPTVTNQFAIISAGELEVESGGDGAVSIFRAGDISLATDRTGEGHINRVRGTLFATIMVMDTEHLW